ncbi:hypothetical protein V2G26_003751 [Clonostachys chloroleuca]
MRYFRTRELLAPHHLKQPVIQLLLEPRSLLSTLPCPRHHRKQTLLILYQLAKEKLKDAPIKDVVKSIQVLMPVSTYAAMCDANTSQVNGGAQAAGASWLHQGAIIFASTSRQSTRVKLCHLGWGIGKGAKG